MAVIRVAPKRGTGEGLANDQWENAYTLVLNVWTNDPDDGPAVILSSPLVPKVGDEYATGNDYDPGSFCRTVTPRRDSSVDTLWEVTCEYRNIPPESVEPNPVLRPAVFDWSNRREEFFFPRDSRGNWYRTPAGVPLEKPPPTRLSLLILTITKNVTNYNALAMNAAQDAVNTAPFLGFAPGYAKVEDIVPSKLQREGNWSYYTMETVIAFRRIPWHPHYEVAKGRQYKTGEGDLLPTDAGGVYDDHEVYLDADGKQTDTPYMLEFYPYPEMNFSLLAQFTGVLA